MSTETVIFIGVAIYMLLMLGVGAYASKKAHTVAEFMVAGRDMPLAVCTMTIIATWFGGAMMLGGAGAAYDEGMYGVIEDPWGGALALILIGLFFARMFRRLRMITVADFMAQRFGKVASMGIVITSLFSNIVWVGATLVAFGVVFESLTSIPLETGIIGGAVVIFIYTAVGGMWAVALTDFVQMLIIMLGLVILLITVLIDIGGWSAIAPQLPEHTFRMLPLEHTGEEWLQYLRAWTIIGLVDISAQPLFQRVASARSERVAQNSFYLGGFGYLIFGLIPVALGIIGSVVMPDLPLSERIVPALAIEHLHPVGIAIFVGAMLAAIMSSADSALLSIASILGKNVLPIIKPDASEKLALQVARWAIPVAGIVALVVALKIKIVFQLMINANILGLAAIIVPFILGVYWSKANRTGALSAMAAGIIAWLTTLFVAPTLPADFVGLGVCLLTMLIVTPLTQKFDPPRPLCDGEGNPVESVNRLGTLPLFKRT